MTTSPPRLDRNTSDILMHMIEGGLDTCAVGRVERFSPARNVRRFSVRCREEGRDLRRCCERIIFFMTSIMYGVELICFAIFASFRVARWCYQQRATSGRTRSQSLPLTSAEPPTNNSAALTTRSMIHRDSLAHSVRLSLLSGQPPVRFPVVRRFAYMRFSHLQGLQRLPCYLCYALPPLTSKLDSSVPPVDDNDDI